MRESGQYHFEARKISDCPIGVYPKISDQILQQNLKDRDLGACCYEWFAAWVGRSHAQEGVRGCIEPKPSKNQLVNVYKESYNRTSLLYVDTCDGKKTEEVSDQESGSYFSESFGAWL